MQAELIVDATAHTYTLDGVQLPSVTGILRAAGIIDTTFFTAPGRERGSQVHEALHYYDVGDLDETSVPEHLKGYVAAYQKFLGVSGFKPLLIEMPVHSRKHGFAGRLDRFGLLNSNCVLIDIKTGKAPAWVSLQLAAYVLALREIEQYPAPIQRMALELTADGKFKLKSYDDPADTNRFLQALAVAKGKV